jgi:hypothetical protein
MVCRPTHVTATIGALNCVADAKMLDRDFTGYGCNQCASRKTHRKSGFIGDERRIVQVPAVRDDVVESSIFDDGITCIRHTNQHDIPRR